MKLTHVLLFLALFTPVQASYIPPEPYVWPVAYKERVTETKRLISEIGGQLGASRSQQELIYKIIKCENRDLDPTLQSYHKRPDGSREESYGLSQIYLPAHPSVSKSDATDPVFSIGFIVQNVVDGNAYWWTCAKIVQ